MNPPEDCYTCAQEALGDAAPARERIACDDVWRVAHAFNSALPGWLVLVPRRTARLAAELGGAGAA
jgi:diadenosine tetraphosphate (Ap4A) HIT family hydrolase